MHVLYCGLASTQIAELGRMTRAGGSLRHWKEEVKRLSGQDGSCGVLSVFSGGYILVMILLLRVWAGVATMRPSVPVKQISGSAWRRAVGHI